MIDIARWQRLDPILISITGSPRHIQSILRAAVADITELERQRAALLVWARQAMTAIDGGMGDNDPIVILGRALVAGIEGRGDQTDELTRVALCARSARPPCSVADDNEERTQT